MKYRIAFSGYLEASSAEEAIAKSKELNRAIRADGGSYVEMTPIPAGYNAAVDINVPAEVHVPISQQAHHHRRDRSFMT